MPIFKPVCNLCSAKLDFSGNYEGRVEIACGNADCVGSTAAYSHDTIDGVEVNETANQLAERWRANAATRVAQASQRAAEGREFDIYQRAVYMLFRDDYSRELNEAMAVGPAAQPTLQRKATLTEATVYGRCCACGGNAYGRYAFAGSMLTWALCGSCRKRWARTSERVA